MIEYIIRLRNMRYGKDEASELVRKFYSLSYREAWYHVNMVYESGI